MDQENAVIERDEEQLDTSSDDLRSALTSCLLYTSDAADE